MNVILKKKKQKFHRKNTDFSIHSFFSKVVPKWSQTQMHIQKIGMEFILE